MAKCEESHIAHYLSVIDTIHCTSKKKIYRIKKIAQSRAIFHSNATSQMATSCLYHVCRVFNKSKTYLNVPNFLLKEWY